LPSLSTAPGALLVANHSGALFPFDASMMVVAMMKEHPLPRWPRFLVLNWAFELPYLSIFMRRVGGVPASPHNAERLLEQDELVMVFPEGVKGTGKPFSERYRLQRFGRGGFVEVALRTRAPIVPVAVVGAEEISSPCRRGGGSSSASRSTSPSTRPRPRRTAGWSST
jgi:1-acyl-sn-glycerol-3-phosphate acyltransferase